MLGYNFENCQDDPCKTEIHSPTKHSVVFAIMQATQEGVLENAGISNREDAFKFWMWTFEKALRHEPVIARWASNDPQNNSIYTDWLKFIECVGLIGVVVYWTR